MIKKRLIGYGLALVMFASGLALATDDNLTQDEQAGIEAYNQGDLVSAMTFFERAAEAGSALAQTRLAWILDSANDDVRAVELYRAAATQNYAPGMHGLGEMYSKGEGVEKSLEKAVAWFEKAAEAGHEKSLRLLNRAYEEGGLGLEPDPAKAEVYRKQLESMADASAMGERP